MNMLQVIIVGEDNLQNGLLIDVLRRHAMRCDLAAPTDLTAMPLAAPGLALVDVAGCGPADVVARLEALGGARRMLIGLLNAMPSISADLVFQHRSVRGFFYPHARPEQVIAGAAAILAGEYWLPRKDMALLLDRALARLPEPRADPPGLTPKELQTLRLLASGGTNAEIARRLHVSEHTVKTHLYRLFRKLNVSNRMQASNWASRNVAPLAQEDAVPPPPLNGERR